MNNLSWLLYWADVLPSLSRWVCVIAFVATLFFGFIYFLGVTGCFGAENKGPTYRHYGEEHINDAYTLSPRFRKAWPLVVISLVLWGSSFLVPNKDTFYLIAASEAGEEVAQTPEFKKIRVIIGNWLDDKIEEAEGAKKEVEAE